MLMRLAIIGVITILGMGGQFLVRAVLTSQLGPSRDLDIFFVSMGWAGAVATAIFQVMAMVLAPHTVTAGSLAIETRSLTRQTALILTVTTTVLSFVATAMVAACGFSSSTFVILIVLLGWGVGSGLALYQRQLLLAWDRPMMPALLNVLPAAVMLTLAMLGIISGTSGFAVSGAITWLVIAAIGGTMMTRMWQHAGNTSSTTQPTIQASAPLKNSLTTLSFWSLLRTAAPAFAASWNSQLNQRIQDIIAAVVIIGGATIYGNAIALARLPQTIADALFSATAYPVALRAIAAHDPLALRFAYRLGLRVHLAVSVPVAVAVLIAAQAATSMIFAHGACTNADAQAIAQVLWWAAPGMVATSLQAVHANFLLAMGRTATGLRIELVLTILSLASALILLPWMHLSGITAGHALALIVIQVFMLRALGPIGLRWHDTLIELLRALLPALPAAALAYWISSIVDTSPWIQSLTVGASILIITIPCSTWAIASCRKAAASLSGSSSCV